jgi:hypothetical protein
MVTKNIKSLINEYRKLKQLLKEDKVSLNEFEILCREKYSFQSS